MIRIACLGISVQDRLYYISTLPRIGGKYVARDYQEVGGGPAATAAVAAARLGAIVDFFGRVGDDYLGMQLVKELENFNVNTQNVQHCFNARSSQSAILVDDNGERIIINYPSPDLSNEVDWLLATDFSHYDMLLADVRWMDGAMIAFQQARKAAIPTLLDADITPQDIRPLIELADHIVFSEPALYRLTEDNNIFQALRKAAYLTSGKLYVTAGEKGCFWLENDNVYHQSAFSVKVKDTTGAGDVFHGALAVFLSQKLPTAQAVRYANAVAALKCTRKGGRLGIPTFKEMTEFLACSS
ncbi:PfkB family carbohydrate kinase [Zymomonas mobilis]|uniref:PfkB domain protein n=1 Tax=Zymomonas mobilis subsp. mobilis (strain ATCC 31821 / ZM4 / CP4) TaxID=264203 RepID=A0A806DAC0_ZYMMO|nr:PfkB family carbohydrate kinase [Zymomonas mobilis]ADC33859.1 PfkB domain protein [Zymomonas mobilis subsp. mobilis ZM4 = ATCC 31821]AHB11084.1 sugar kinase, ribokinase [Zymomonas mobilis subsp. mobilis str. CP4 = NRRL B-14023]AHJ71366.1 Ribokinase [Zymomonas mobilis subsp. mobilis NRRL B-12526]AHJ73204.1 Ribokinase [Zymomonas mobilis subsp. mobilis str. CP4 = NRRL B-14023]